MRSEYGGGVSVRPVAVGEVLDAMVFYAIVRSVKTPDPSMNLLNPVVTRLLGAANVEAFFLAWRLCDGCSQAPPRSDRQPYRCWFGCLVD